MKQNTNYVQAGDTIACGHCMPKQGFALPETYGVKCDCFCHRTRKYATGETTGEFKIQKKQKWYEGTISLPRKPVKWVLWLVVIGLLIASIIIK